MKHHRKGTLHPSSAVTGISCDDLFGQYTYRLGSADPTSGTSSPHLMLLYGDNGSGKTTIAQLLFHMLSRADGRGHRSYLAKTKFRRFSVHFDDGRSLVAERPDANLRGPYELQLRDSNGAVLESVQVTTSEDGAVKSGNVDESKLTTILSTALPSDFEVYFLSDSRVFHSDAFDKDPSEEWFHHRGRLVTRRFGDSIEHMIVESPTRDLTVGPSVARTETWLRRQAFSASRAGEQTTSTIYADIIKRIAQTSSTDSKPSSERLDSLMAMLGDLAKRSESYSQLGLSQTVPIDALSTHIGSLGDEQRQVVASVLEPYVDSIASRLDAFADLQQRLTTFLRIINSLYKRKSVTLTPGDGIAVHDSAGEPLDMELLSSGEKQLMLLLCNILVATTGASIFIIDEPELSLNVKWQRQLVDDLLALVQQTQVQFVMATHSIELLSKHKECVVQLNDDRAKGGVA
ncbi:MAG: AAA family ATPase [Planctomycetaceae bacterium]